MRDRIAFAPPRVRFKPPAPEAPLPDKGSTAANNLAKRAIKQEPRTIQDKEDTKIGIKSLLREFSFSKLFSYFRSITRSDTKPNQSDKSNNTVFKNDKIEVTNSGQIKITDISDRSFDVAQHSKMIVQQQGLQELTSLVLAQKNEVPTDEEFDDLVTREYIGMQFVLDGKTYGGTTGIDQETFIKALDEWLKVKCEVPSENIVECRKFVFMTALNQKASMNLTGHIYTKVLPRDKDFFKALPLNPGVKVTFHDVQNGRFSLTYESECKKVDGNGTMDLRIPARNIDKSPIFANQVGTAGFTGTFEYDFSKAARSTDMYDTNSETFRVASWEMEYDLGVEKVSSQARPTPDLSALPWYGSSITTPQKEEVLP